MGNIPLRECLYDGLTYSPHAVWAMMVVYPMRILNE
jgi:hypothetical protein